MSADRLPPAPDVPDFDPEAKARLATGPDVKGLIDAVQRAQVEAVLGDKKPPLAPDHGVDQMMKARAERGKSDRLPGQVEQPQHWRTSSDLEPL
jgi:hypothetical protein